MQTYRPEFRRFVEPSILYKWARRLEARLEFSPHPLSQLPRLTGWDGGFVLLIGACLMAMAFLAPTLWHKQIASQSREAVA